LLPHYSNFRVSNSSPPLGLLQHCKNEAGKEMSIGGEEDKDTGYTNVEEGVASSWKFC